MIDLSIRIHSVAHNRNTQIILVKMIHNFIYLSSVRNLEIDSKLYIKGPQLLMFIFIILAHGFSISK